MSIYLSLGSSSSTSVNQKLKLVARQNRRLREILRCEFAPDISAKDFCLLNVAQISELINAQKLDKDEGLESNLEGRSFFYVLIYHNDMFTLYNSRNSKKIFQWLLYFIINKLMYDKYKLIS